MKSKLPKDTFYFFFFFYCGLNLTPTNQSTLVDIHIDKMRSTRIQKEMRQRCSQACNFSS